MSNPKTTRRHAGQPPDSSISAEPLLLSRKKKKPRLTRRQRELLNAINPQNRYRLDHALLKTNVKQWLFERWLADPVFLQHLRRRILGLELNHFMFLQYCQPIAADRLITLMHYKRGDVVQKACANLFHMVKHSRRIEKEYDPDQTPSLAPAPDPLFVSELIQTSRATEEFMEQYGHLRLPEIPNPQDYY